MSLPEFTHGFNAFEAQAVVRAIDSGKTDDVYLLDVREDFEVAAVPPLPHAIVIPFRDLDDAFKMWGSAFKTKYGVRKPGKKDRILVYAFNARRAANAALYLGERGYKLTAFLNAKLSEYLESTQSEVDEDL